MNDLINNIDKIHTTEMGETRIKYNLNLDNTDATSLVQKCNNKCRIDNVTR